MGWVDRCEFRKLGTASSFVSGKTRGSIAHQLDKPWFYFNEQPQPATERSAVSTLYGAPLVRH